MAPVTVRLLVRHDMGCKFARASADFRVDDDGNVTAGEITPGHSDAAKRVSDIYNLHKSAGAPVGHWIAVQLGDGSSDGCAYPDKAAAVWHQHNSESWFAFIKLHPGSLSVCQAESLLEWQRHANRLRTNDRDYRRGGLDVIPRLTVEDHYRQMAALTGRGSLPVGLGYQ